MKQPKITSLVTHAGEAHKDDFLATCILAAIWPDAPIVRVKETVPREWLEDPNVLVFDVGGEYDPTKNNYDHHQLGPDNTRCSLVMILDALGWLSLAQKVWVWLPTVSYIDTRGLKATSEKFRMNYQDLISLKSPIDQALLTLFSAQTLIAVDDRTIRPLLQMLGNMLHHELQREFQLMHYDINSFETIPLGAYNAVYHDGKFSVPEITRIYQYKNLQAPLITVFPNSRSDDKFTASRSQRCKHVIDFNHMREDPRVEYVPAGGYMAVFSGDYHQFLQDAYRATLDHTCNPAAAFLDAMPLIPACVAI